MHITFCESYRLENNNTVHLTVTWNQSAGLPSENCFGTLIADAENCFGTLIADGVVIVLTILCCQCNWNNYIVADTEQYHNRLNTIQSQ